MAFNEKIRQDIVDKFGLSAQDTGSTTVQVALLTQKIKQLTEHLHENPKDFSSKRGMLNTVSLRKKLLRYLEKSSPSAYKQTIERLGLKR
jgi:small subunit ribosomal protein S15